ncbi:MAG TPA: S8 family serine peptidase [Bdellovibrionota bacterium]|nr:S8 family serine peptidase [Bdellovibrionota bacterium]
MSKANSFQKHHLAVCLLVLSSAFSVHRTEAEESKKAHLPPRLKDPAGPTYLSSEGPDRLGYIVQFHEPSLLAKMQELGIRNTPALLSLYEHHLVESQERTIREIEAIVGRPVSAGRVRGRFQKVLNAIAIDISEKEAEQARQLEDVKSVVPNFRVDALLSESVPMISADQAWGMSDGSGNPIRGQGIRIAIIDTGVDYTHPDLGSCFIPPESPTCFPEAPLTINGCFDSDGGVNACHRGYGTFGDGLGADYCASSTLLKEESCNTDGTVAWVDVSCPLGCFNGNCIPEEHNLDAEGCSKVAGGYDFVTCDWFDHNGECTRPKSEDPDPMDVHGHGTHVASIASGDGVLLGVAPDAEILAYRVLNGQGFGFDSWVIGGIERAIDPNGDGDFSDRANVMNLSLGGLAAIPGDDPLVAAVNAAVQAGSVVVVAAGNDYDFKTIASPGVAGRAITVAAVGKNGVRASFSSGGPAEILGFPLKPDVAAPGVSICAAQFDDSFGFDPPQCVDNYHVLASGTSMATPHVAGAAALLLQARPQLTPDQIKSVLMLSANPQESFRHLGHLDQYQSVGFPVLDTLEICTRVQIEHPIISSEAFFSVAIVTEVSPALYALIREDQNNSPGVIIAQSPWEPAGSGYLKASLPSIGTGTYWLCSQSATPMTAFPSQGATLFEADRYLDSGTSRFLEPPSPNNSIYMSLFLRHKVPADPYQVGGGLINVKAALSTPIFTSPSAVDFGFIHQAGTYMRTFAVGNVSASALSLSISSETSKRNRDFQGNLFDEENLYNYVSILSSPSSLGSGQVGTVTASLEIPPAALSGYYSGEISIACGPTTFRVPYTFTVGFEAHYVAPFRSTTVPVPDGSIGNTEWSDAARYSSLGTNGAFELFLKTGINGGSNTLFIGVIAQDPNVTSLSIYFDEGDNGSAGAGSFDRILTIDQEDLKSVATPAQPSPNYMDGFFSYFFGGKGWSTNGSFGATDPYINFSGSGRSYGNHVEAEFAIPFVGVDQLYAPDFNDASDLNLAFGNVIGFGIIAESKDLSLPAEFNPNDGSSYTGKIVLQAPVYGRPSGRNPRRK